MIVLISLIFPLIFLTPAFAQVQFPEFSGLVLTGDTLLLVDDARDGMVYAYPAKRIDADACVSNQDGSAKLCKLSASDIYNSADIIDGFSPQLADDMESVDLLCQFGAPCAPTAAVVLSEDNTALVTRDGTLATYGDAFSEVNNTGLEGLAVKPCTAGCQGREAFDVAAVWEGGWRTRSPVQPKLCLHRLEIINTREDTLVCSGNDYVQLRAQHVSDTQRFRAPDLVWSKLTGVADDSWGLITLLASTQFRGPPYERRVLRRFRQDGNEIEPCNTACATPRTYEIDLDKIAETISPAAKEIVSNANWEGLSWNELGTSVILINDVNPKVRQPHLLYFDLPADWQWQP